MRRNSLHRVRKRGITRLRNRSNAAKTEREGVENFSYLAKDVACRLFAFVFCTKFHLLQIPRIRQPHGFLTYVTVPNVLVWFVRTGCSKKSTTWSLSREDYDFYAIETCSAHAYYISGLYYFTIKRIFLFFRIEKQFRDNKKTRKNLMFYSYPDWYRSTNWISLSVNVTTSHNRFFTNADPISFPARDQIPIEIWLSIRRYRAIQRHHRGQMANANVINGNHNRATFVVEQYGPPTNRIPN